MKKEMLVIGVILLVIGIPMIPVGLSEQTQGKAAITVDDEPGDADYSSIKRGITTCPNR